MHSPAASRVAIVQHSGCSQVTCRASPGVLATPSHRPLGRPISGLQRSSRGWQISSNDRLQVRGPRAPCSSSNSGSTTDGEQTTTSQQHEVEVLPAEEHLVTSTSASAVEQGETSLRARIASKFATALGGSVLLSGFLGTGFNLGGTTSVLEALGVLAAIVAVHEAGHFLAARTQNIHVSKFAIGFGPPLIKYQGPEVEYSLRAIPLGGFVAFPDDDVDCPYPADDPDLLRNRPILDRAIVISAGVIANVIFGFSILFTQASTVGVYQSIFHDGVKVPQVIEGAVAQRSGLQSGDIIMKIDDAPILGDVKSVNNVVDLIRTSADKQLLLTIDRKGESVQVPVTPAQAPDGGGRIGVQLSSNADIKKVVASSPGQAVELASGEFLRLMGAVTGGLQQIFTNFSKTAEQVSGPVAIVAVGAEAARSDVTGLFQFGAILNINLAVVNILPLPALDGGYLLLLAIEAVRGKKLPQGVENGVMASGLILLTGLGAALIVHDTLNLAIFKGITGGL